MSFTSLEFLLFFSIVLSVFACLRTESRRIWLLLFASICFYLSWNIPCIFLILFTSIADFAVARALGQTQHPVRRKRLLLTSILTNLGILGFFKYTNFVLGNLSSVLIVCGFHVTPLHYDIILPPAISYFTFASISYVIDVYQRRIMPCDNLRDYSLFVTFFPKLLSGPIVRAADFLPQLKQRTRLAAVDIETGVAYLLTGALKKLVIADQVASNVNMIFAAPAQFDGLTLAQGLLGFAVQLYCDFSGYSDIAIGCARLLGFRIAENFQMPFSSTSITEFWRRWHISLSTWLRDYLFLPITYWFLRRWSSLSFLGLNEEYWGYFAATLVTMLLCGLWHGAGWTFLVFGAIHGLALCVHRVWLACKHLGKLTKKRGFRIVWNSFSRLLTLSVVLLSFLFFKATSISSAFVHLKRMISWTHDGTRLVSPNIILAVLLVSLIHLFPIKDRILAQDIPKASVPVRILAYSSILVVIVALAATDSAPFIYFQF